MKIPTTSWSMVLAAGGANAEEALARICETYWYPLYGFLRRQGYSSSEAEDLTQGFLARLIEKGYLASANPKRGRFRSFLLTALKHFAANERDHHNAQKRGGGLKMHRSLDLRTAEDRLAFEPPDLRTPEKLYERDWALAVLERVQGQLREESVRVGKESQYAVLLPYLAGGGEADDGYAGAAQKLGMTESAFKVAVHRIRKRFRQTLRDEIAATVDDPEEIDQELSFLLAALRD